ncbi:hypothetical protein IV203_031490 [Nitzschia inconspicua]|uniref:Uncharacterized protein n=1 Tax=Nitzschia inconspicua TaxID=303405 RepID=A0A9K3LUZ0_9STRA|nr:hypothetical protein IV203_031490 [Nitzschia inconspicua]
MKFVLALILAAVACGVEGFAPSKMMVRHHNQPSTTTSSSSPLNSMRQGSEDMKQTATASLIAATLILGNAFTVGPAIAASLDDAYDFAGSSQMVAARSGGRAGGRSAGARAAPRPSSTTTINTRVIERTHYVPSYSSPSVILAPPIYNPLPGYGLGLGLNAINQIGNDIRDYRQENEIRDARVQLEQARIRETEMEARLRALEQGQQGQLTSQQLLMLQQMQQQQQSQQTVPSN